MEFNTTEHPFLSAMEARVLGALMEKQLATPDAYPLTLNSLQLACNQKTSREQISNYQVGELQACLNDLRERQLIEVDYGTRAARFNQRLSRLISFDKAAQALMCVMLLRGPQTLNELLARTQRLYEFADIADVEEKLDHLCAKTNPTVTKINRQPGQREDRYMHLLCGEPSISSSLPPAAPAYAGTAADDRIAALEARIEVLERRMEDISNSFANFLKK